MRIYYVYIMTNKRKNVLYIGVMRDLQHRVLEHKQERVKGFTSQYKVKQLIYYEEFDSAYDAIHREKQLKRWRRSKKEELIRKMNSGWNDLSAGWY